MTPLTDSDVRHIATLARLKLSGAEVKKFTKELGAILTSIDLLNEIDTSAVEPTTQVTGLTNVQREDSVKPSEATTEELLACSPLPIVKNQIETFSAHG